MHACMHVRTCFSDDNRYEHGVTRSGTGMRIPVSGTKAAQQRSDASDDNRYEHGVTQCGTGMRIPVSGTKAAQQRSDARTYTV